ncbi:MAG TPA: tetratricopeptide repeat protein [Humisphaera sp.]|jgi:tetratricopeptide (TPR) repeat protein|nr:tetratricopeptide repeat protein [Humisphaera sp.]
MLRLPSKQSKPRLPARDADRRDDPVIEILVMLLIAASAIAALWPVCSHGFVSYDDLQNVALNPRMNPPTLHSLMRFWTGPYIWMYIPLTYTVWFVLACISQTGGLDETGIRINASAFHTLNLLLHIVAAIAVYRLLRRLVKARWPAAAGAILFAIHPIQVEAVAWVTGLKDVLSGSLALIALWQYVAFAQAAKSELPMQNDIVRPRRSAWWHYGFATFALLLAFLSKPSVVVVPLMAMVIDLLLIRRPWKRIVWNLLPWFAMAALFALIARHVQSIRPSTVAQSPPWSRPLLAMHALAFYLSKVAWPHPLLAQYHQAPHIIIEHGWLYWTWIFPAAIAAIAVVLYKRHPWALAAFGLFIVGPLPVLGLVPFQFEEIALVADRYAYLSMVGVALALAGALALTRRAIWILPLAGCFGLLGVLAFFQTSTMSSSLALYEHELKYNADSDVAYVNLANFYRNRDHPGDMQRAEWYARQEIARFPHLGDGYLALGDILAYQDRPKEALPLLRKGLEIQKGPDGKATGSLNGMGNLAAVLAKLGQFDEAIGVTQQILRISPEDGRAHLNLGVMYVNQNRYDDAINEFAAAIDCNPQDFVAHTFLARVLARKSLRSQALEHYYEALRLAPNYGPAREGLREIQGY